MTFITLLKLNQLSSIFNIYCHISIESSRMFLSRYILILPQPPNKEIVPMNDTIGHLSSGYIIHEPHWIQYIEQTLYYIKKKLFISVGKELRKLRHH